MKRNYIVLYLLIVGTPIVSAQAEDLAQKGNDAFGRGQFARAVEYYSQALAEKPSAMLYVNLGHAYAQLEQWPDATQSYESALAIKDSQLPPARIHGYLGQAEYMRHNYIRTLHHLAQAKQDAAPGNYSLLTARCLIDLQRFHLAESEILECLKSNPNDDNAAELLARIYMQTDRPARAADIYQRLLKQQPSGLRDFKALAQAQIAADRYPQATDTLEMARRIFTPAEQDLDRLLADLYIRQAMYRQAADCYSRLLHNADKPDPEDLYRLGHCYYQSRQFLSTREVFRRVLQLDPSNARAALYLGHIAAEQEEFEVAIEAYTRAARIDPAGAESYVALANIHVKQNQFPQAAGWFKKALARREFDPLEYAHYLETLRQAGHGYQERFIHILKQAISTYPNDIRLNRLLDQFTQETANRSYRQPLRVSNTMK